MGIECKGRQFLLEGVWNLSYLPPYFNVFFECGA